MKIRNSSFMNKICLLSQIEVLDYQTVGPLAGGCGRAPPGGNGTLDVEGVEILLSHIR